LWNRQHPHRSCRAGGLLLDEGKIKNTITER